MIRRRIVASLALSVLAASCVENEAPGNDREAALDPPAAAAERVTASAAIEGVAMELLHPQTMTDADLASIADAGYVCQFRYTRIGLPVLVHGTATAVIKLNGKLAPLSARGGGVYTEAGVRVTMRPLSEGEADGQFPAELVLRIEGAPNELGFHGFSEC